MEVRRLYFLTKFPREYLRVNTRVLPGDTSLFLISRRGHDAVTIAPIDSSKTQKSSQTPLNR